MQSLKDKVAIVGVGCTKFGERFDTGFSDLLIESVKEACEDAGVAPRDLEAAWLGSFRPWFAGERNTGSPLAEAMGWVNKPITLVSNICATGMDALRNACLAVASGVYDLVLAVGVEKMRDLGSRSLSETNRSEGHPFLGKGRTAPGFFASSGFGQPNVVARVRKASSLKTERRKKRKMRKKKKKLSRKNMRKSLSTLK